MKIILTILITYFSVIILLVPFAIFGFSIRGKIQMFWAWYDSWIGAYYNKDRGILYICPFMWIVIVIYLPNK